MVWIVRCEIGFVEQMNDVNDALSAFLAPLASVLDACDPHWAVFGSAALSLCGFDVEVHDVDILTTEDGLAAFRRRFAGCCTCSKVPASTLFRSSMSRFSMDGRQLEVCAGLEVCRQGRWLPVEVQEVTVTDGIRHCSREECRRLLQLFGRAKDLRRLDLLFGID